MDIDGTVNELWKKGYNCAECVFMVLSNELNFELSPQILKMAKIMGSGYYSGCICGSLSASISFCAIYKEPDSKLAKTLYGKFTEKFGASCCRVIRKQCSCTDKITFSINSVLEELQK
ncbi:MAG: C-GCAxxG-C-C family (seleno)protein [Candidatus Diapherotrites archaeon]